MGGVPQCVVLAGEEDEARTFAQTGDRREELEASQQLLGLTKGSGHCSRRLPLVIVRLETSEVAKAFGGLAQLTRIEIWGWVAVYAVSACSVRVLSAGS